MTAFRLLLSATALSAALASMPAPALKSTEMRQDVTLHYTDATGALDAPMRARIIETFFSAHLRERADFPPAAPTQAGIVLHPGHAGVAPVGAKEKAPPTTIHPGWLA